MKTIKGILLFFIISLCFILQCEIYQNELGNFDRAEYMVSRVNVPDEELEGFLAELTQTSDENGVSVFSTSILMESSYKTTLRIYGDTEEIRDELYRTMKISETTYTSLFSGITTVEFYDFSELAAADSYNDNLISYIGQDEDVEAVYETLSKKYSLTYPDYWEITEKDLVIVLWLMVAALLMIINCVEVIRRKKEVVVRRSFGEGAGEIIGASVARDVLLYILVYIAARLFVFHFVSGEFGGKLALLIYVIACLLSFVPYISYSAFDVRKAFSNAGESGAVLWLLYALKLVATVFVIFTISTNLSSINWSGNSDILTSEEYRNNSYLTLQQVNSDGSGTKLWDELFENEYDILKPVICLNILDDNRDYILANEYANEMLGDFKDVLQQMDDDADLVIIVPKSRHEADLKETALSVLEMFADDGFEDLNIQYITYSDSKRLVYMRSDGIYGTEKTKNPVLIYKKSDNVSLIGSSIMNYGANDVFFGITDEDLEKIETEYASYFDGVRLVQTNVYDAYSYRDNFITRLISFLSSLCVITLILDIAIILSVNGMEYRRTAMEHALKQVLGFGLYERNKRMFQRSMGMDLIAVIIACVIGVAITETSPWIVLGVGAVVIIIEVLIICQSILRMERENVQKVLKGGCL